MRACGLSWLGGLHSRRLSPPVYNCRCCLDDRTKATIPQSTQQQSERISFLLRRDLLVTSAQAVWLLAAQPGAAADRGLSRYIKRKQLDPLKTYVPPVLEARGQLIQAGQIMGADIGSARTLLRTGALYGVRDNIRALGEYAVQNMSASQQAADKLVQGVFEALQGFDYTLFQAGRSGKQAPDAEARLQETLVAFDRLLATVPESILEDAKGTLKTITARTADATAAGSQSDARSQQLSLLTPPA